MAQELKLGVLRIRLLGFKFILSGRGTLGQLPNIWVS